MNIYVKNRKISKEQIKEEFQGPRKVETKQIQNLVEEIKTKQNEIYQKEGNVGVSLFLQSGQRNFYRIWFFDFCRSR